MSIKKPGLDLVMFWAALDCRLHGPSKAAKRLALEVIKLVSTNAKSRGLKSRARDFIQLVEKPIVTKRKRP